MPTSALTPVLIEVTTESTISLPTHACDAGSSAPISVQPAMASADGGCACHTRLNARRTLNADCRTFDQRSDSFSLCFCSDTSLCLFWSLAAAEIGRAS